MEKKWNLKEETDEKKYNLSDMVKVGCQDCKGCWSCCEHMGESIVLDPLDVFRITSGLGKSFEEMLGNQMKLHVSEGMILPHLSMVGPKEACVFLGENHRCSIHNIRPGFCRIFPLGRLYEDGAFQYIHLIHACPSENKSKVKVSKWIDTTDIKENQKFIGDWHYFKKAIGDILLKEESEEVKKQLNMFLLHTFYIGLECREDEFYQEFYYRLNKVKENLGIE